MPFTKNNARICLVTLYCHKCNEVNCWQRTSSFVSIAEAEAMYEIPPTPLELVPLKTYPIKPTYHSKIKYNRGVHNGVRYFSYAVY